MSRPKLWPRTIKVDRTRVVVRWLSPGVVAPYFLLSAALANAHSSYIYLAVFWSAGAAVALLGWLSISVKATERGVRVSNVFPRAFNWEEVKRVHWVYTRWGGRIELELHNESPFPIWATRGGTGFGQDELTMQRQIVPAIERLRHRARHAAPREPSRVKTSTARLRQCSGMTPDAVSVG